MKIAVVISVGPGREGLDHAVGIQALLLENLGARLHSIRLAVSRHLSFACQAALDEGPDILAVSGGPRAARRAGQIAHERNMPLIFLPGERAPLWACGLWDSMSLEEIAAALAKGALTPVTLGAGTVSGQIFFENASCGVLPQIAQWPSAMREAESFGDAWREVLRAVNLVGFLLRPGLCLQREDAADAMAGALQITAQIFQETPPRHSCLAPQLGCATWTHSGPLGFGASLMRAAGGGDWRRGARSDRFDCATLSIDRPSGFWLLLDGEPVHIEGAVDFRFIPRAVRSFVFHRDSANGLSVH